MICVSISIICIKSDKLIYAVIIIVLPFLCNKKGSNRPPFCAVHPR